VVVMREEVEDLLRRWVAGYLEGEVGRRGLGVGIDPPPRLGREGCPGVRVGGWEWRLEGREAVVLRVGDAVVGEGIKVGIVVVVGAGMAKGLGLWLCWMGEGIATGMRLVAARDAGDARGEAKLAGSRGIVEGEPTLDIRKGGRVAARGRVGVPPVSR
jgi:hypothetical protein